MSVEPATTRRTPPNTTSTPRNRPLLVRPDARFDCFGDGLCCTDIHALGPVTRAEKREVELLAPGSLVRHKDLLAPVFRTQSNGECVLRSARGCELHAQFGAQAKPTGCARFPYGLVSTPEGGRITTEHRCPCRTLGERPAITPEGAAESLRDSAGRLSGNGKVGPRLAIEPGRRVSFARFRELEQPILEALLANVDPFEALDAKPFGKLEGERWRQIADDMLKERDGTAYGEAMVWCGNALRALIDESKLELAPRPWAPWFDRAEKRAGDVKRKPQTVLNDWLADLLWSLDWAFATRSFRAGRRELATVYALALSITDRLIRARVRSDRAAAEAVMILELVRQSSVWERVQLAL